MKDVPAGLKSMTVWIPLPVSRGGQTISDIRIDSPLTGRRPRKAHSATATPTRRSTIRRPAISWSRCTSAGRAAKSTTAKLAEKRASQAELERALKADKLVTLSPRVSKLADEVTAGKTAPIDQAHAIYDYLWPR